MGNNKDLSYKQMVVLNVEKVGSNKTAEYKPKMANMSGNRIQVPENPKKGTKDQTMLKSSIFNRFFKEYSKDIWTSCDSQLNLNDFVEDAEANVYSKDWCFRV